MRSNSNVILRRLTRSANWLKGTLLVCAAVALSAPAAEASDTHNIELSGQQIEAGLHRTMLPFVQKYCASCHDKEKSKGDLDLTAYSSMRAIEDDERRWELVLDRLQAGEMPPKKAKLHPSPAERQAAIAWVQSMRHYEAWRNAGDPGPVFARRLSNAEYDYTIRDLTGIDMRPASGFPVDPANEAGFDNSGESLTMSPSLVKKYLEAARKVSEHLVLKPSGFEFAPFPVIADTDYDKFCVNRIVAFYRQQRTDYADYFLAAWRYQNRAVLGEPNATLDDIAAKEGISAKYLKTIWTTLTQTRQAVGPIAAVQAMWRGLPSAHGATEDGSHLKQARAGCEQMRDFVTHVRARLVPNVPNLTFRGENPGSQPLVLWKDRQFVANRMRYCGGAMELSDIDLPEGTPAAQAMQVPDDPEAAERYEFAFNQFCSVFPDAFYISERARVFLKSGEDKGNTGRLLSAGFHNQMGYFRDDGPLYQLMLTGAQQRELDELWKELDFIAQVPMRQHRNFLWSERVDSRYMRDADFDFARAENKDCTSAENIQKVCDVYVAKARRLGASDTVIEAVERHFKDISARIRWVEQARIAAEPSHLQALLAFAERAYRRPISQSERDGIIAFYHQLRDKDGLEHEDAVRDTLASILMSPRFCYRLDLPRRSQAISAATASDAPIAWMPLDDYALASRLSYFLWSSMPDQQLLDLAAAGRLHEPQVMIEQARRMLKDDRARGLATEFAGNWLDFRRFEEHNSVDRGRFPMFNNALRSAMFEEPIRFFLNVARNDCSIFDFLYADYTFVNPVLARHYGMPEPGGSTNDTWVRIDHAGQYGRGGLMPMAAFLTKNSPGLRTSPVKRGNWVIRRLLGERVPPPPPNVPQLPSDESKLGNLTLRETLARHRADPACAGCHERIDPFGVVFEGYGPVGERRDKDLGGKPVETATAFPGGGEGVGLDGLRHYIKGRRQKDFVDNLCRELLAYGLGRTLQLSDEPLLEQMHAKLSENRYHFDALIDCIVSSPQFLNRRAGTELAKESN